MNQTYAPTLGKVRSWDAALHHSGGSRTAAKGRKYHSLGLNRDRHSALQRIRTPDPNQPKKKPPLTGSA